MRRYFWMEGFFHKNLSLPEKMCLILEPHDDSYCIFFHSGCDPGEAKHSRQDLLQASDLLERQRGGQAASPGRAGSASEGPVHPHPRCHAARAQQRVCLCTPPQSKHNEQMFQSSLLKFESSHPTDVPHPMDLCVL